MAHHLYAEMRFVHERSMTTTYENLPDLEMPAFKSRTVALVGLMGAGKSTVGRRLAELLGRAFFDSDEEVEKAAGLTIADIFSTYGEDDFRRGERAVIERLLEAPPCVLATGGGAFMDAHTRKLLSEKAITVWLSADLDTLWKRVSKKDTRPLLRKPNPKTVLAELLKEREPIYRLADIAVDSLDGPHNQTVEAIHDVLKVWTAK